MNSATYKGGGIYYNYRPPLFDNQTLFSNNSAQYGRNYASYPVTVGFRDNNSSNRIFINQVSSGLAINQSIKLELLDVDHQVMTLDSSSHINIKPGTQKSSIKGINVERVTKGITEFASLIPVSEPGTSNVKYLISSKSIDKVKVKHIFRNSVLQPEIIINFSYCKPGERVIENQ